MPRRELLSPAQRDDLLTFPTDERLLVRYYTLSTKDFSLIRRHRSDTNRLGFAIQLCYLRYPGQALGNGECPPQPLLNFAAKQLHVPASAWSDYATRDETRREHLQELQILYGYQSFTGGLYRKMTTWLLPQAIDTNKGIVMVTRLLEQLRRQRIIVPSLTVIERLCSQVLTRAQEELAHRLTDGLNDSHRHKLDALLRSRTGAPHSVLAWLRQPAMAAAPRNVLTLIEKLLLLRKIGLPTGTGETLSANRLLQLAREGSRLTVQHLQELDLLKKYATLVALALDQSATLTDEILSMHDRLIGTLFTQSQRAHAESFQQSGKAINEKVRLYVKIGQALIDAKAKAIDPFQAIEAVVPWEVFQKTVKEAEVLARPEDFDYLDRLQDGYGQLKRYMPELFDTFDFHAAPGCQDLVDAINTLRELYQKGRRTLPAEAPTGFIRERWQPYIIKNEALDRRYYELCVWTELRNALRSGDLWVTGSRQFKDFESYLLPRERFEEMVKSSSLSLAISADAQAYVQERSQLLEAELQKVNALAAAGQLPDASMTNGTLKITPLEATTPSEALDLMRQAYALLPRVKITDILLDVDAWTRFTRHFTHLRSNDPAADRTLLLTALLSDAINLGLSKMADACPGVSLARLTWLADWYIRDETYSKALAELVNYQHRLPMAAMWGDGTTSSSDGQRFPTGGRGEAGGQVNARYGHEPGVFFYTHTSDQYAPFHTKLISATVRDATYVLDGLLYHESDLRIEEHYTDTAGFTDHVFALCHLLGFRFAPRIRDLNDRRLYTVNKPKHYPALEPLIGGMLQARQITTHWPDLLRLATSIKQGTATASLLLRKLGAYPRQNSLAVALREVGRLERTLFTLEWLQDPELRRRVQLGLNKGEARNALARAVCFNRLGEIRDRSYENQRYRASGLNLVVAAIVLWNTVYLERAIAELKRQGRPILDDWLTHLSPLGWEHINLTGDYVWREDQRLARGQFRPLQTSAQEAICNTVVQP